MSAAILARRCCSPTRRPRSWPPRRRCRGSAEGFPLHHASRGPPPPRADVEGARILPPRSAERGTVRSTGEGIYSPPPNPPPHIPDDPRDRIVIGRMREAAAEGDRACGED